MKKKKKTAHAGKGRSRCTLRLYVANTTARSVLARQNAEHICEQYLKGECLLTIVDLVKQPELAREHEIVAIPTLVRIVPGPEKRVIGSLGDMAQVLRALELGAPGEASEAALLDVGVRVGHA